MAKYQVNFSCGHTGEVVLFGTNASREKRIERFEKSGLCPECYKVNNADKLEELHKENVEHAKENNLPKLNGSEKQVAWAMSIRKKMLEQVEEEIEQYSYLDDEFYDLLVVQVHLKNTENRAAFFIKWRGVSPDVLHRVIKEEMSRRK